MHPPIMQQVVNRLKRSMAAVEWFIFAPSLPSGCAGFMTFAAPVLYGCLMALFRDLIPKIRQLPDIHTSGI